MRLERLNYNKIKVFLTFDDLTERGLTKDDLWQDLPKVHQLFRDMMKEASVELGFEADGPIAVEIFSLQAQGMVVIVSKTNDYDDEFEEDFHDEYIQLQVTLDECHDVFYEIAEFEDVVALAKRLSSLGIEGGTLYSYQNTFFIEFDVLELEQQPIENIIAILSEFGNPSTLTTYRVQEYGKVIIEQQAIQQLCHYFK